MGAGDTWAELPRNAAQCKGVAPSSSDATNSTVPRLDGTLPWTARCHHETMAVSDNGTYFYAESMQRSIQNAKSSHPFLGRESTCSKGGKQSE